MNELTNPQHREFAHRFVAETQAGRTRADAGRTAYQAVFGPVGYDVSANARRLLNRAAVKAYIAQLQAGASRMVELDAGWALQQLLGLMRAAGSFNLDDFLGPADAQGFRYYDLGKVSREQMALLSELSVESHTVLGGPGVPDREVHKVKLKGPEKFAEQRQIIALMARIGGWEAPTKSLNANVDLRELIREAAAPALAPPETQPTG